MMRLVLFLAILLAGLPLAAPVQAQATADQLNRLSLEALTARPSGGGGYERRSFAPRYRGAYRTRSSYRGRSYRARRYSPHYRSYARPAPYRHGYGRSGYRSYSRAATHRAYHR